jgi:hypothetical protein
MLRNSRSLRLVVHGTLAALAGCSSPAPQPTNKAVGSVDGTVGGHALAVSDGVAVAASGSAIPHVYAILGDRAGFCPLLQGATGSEAATNQIANLTSLEFHLYDNQDRTVSPAVYPVPMSGMTGSAPLEADIVFSVQGPNCEMVLHQWATAGTVTVSALTPSLSGTYDLTFGTDHVTGSFDVPYCDGVHVQGTGGSVPPVCEK